MNFVDHDVASGTKGAIHGSLLTLAALCAVYNICAQRARPSSHLLLNAVVYTGLIGFEVMNVARHCHKGCAP